MNSCPWGEIERIGNDVLKDLEQINTPHLIVDLSALEYIGSAMVALVVRIWKLVKSKNARMVVVNKNPMVLEVFKIAKLDEVWEIVEFRQDALDVLGVTKTSRSERRESNALLFFTLLAAIASGSALGVDLTNPGILVDPLRQILIFACSGMGVVLGLLFTVRSQGGRKAVGFLATVVSLGVLVAACIVVPVNPNQAAAKEPNAKDDGSAKSPAEESTKTEASQTPVAPNEAEKTPAPQNE
jgi:anti-anti-sigma factor